ncbi:hypothetical protein [Holdemania filiformis]|uniref:Uncharacterized protein n=1 Tax=Holdemania filiformis DSM 12042 TaxID=545696 RepID=B9Y2V9_9FIRM|nr:hypothetical protein [Holdemania filiformis]EEF69684.1 hypothetical protein HOLDEFILI_00134 [Holdemania filiformis DSM 12042]MCQ4952090.1 hypothetical protein [Holdemania filiformis]
MKQKQFTPSQRCRTPRFQTGTPQSTGTFKIKRSAEAAERQSC